MPKRKPKPRVGRPPRKKNEVVRFQILLWLIRGEDDDIIKMLNDVDPKERSRFVKRILREGPAKSSHEEQVSNEQLVDDLFANF